MSQRRQYDLQRALTRSWNTRNTTKLAKINKKYNSKAISSSMTLPLLPPLKPITAEPSNVHSAVVVGSLTTSLSSNNLLTKSNVLKNISYENIIAARSIQRYYRGYATRKELWRRNGLLTVACVKKIQRVWRGFKGRLIAYEAIKDRMHDAANKIIRLFYGWWYRRFRRMLREELTKRAVTKLQAHYRGSVARAQYAIMLFEYRTKKARIIARVARGYLGRRRYRGIKKRLKQFYELMKLVRQMNISNDPQLLLHHPHHVPQVVQWRLFLLCLLHQFVSHNSDKSVACSTELFQQYPSFAMNSFCLQFSLLSAWASYGKAKVIREDFLEEAVEMYIASNPNAFTNLNTESEIALPKPKKARTPKPNTLSSKSRATATASKYQFNLLTEAATTANSVVGNPAKSLWGKPFRYRNLITGHIIDPVSQFLGGIPEEIEFMVFKAGMMISGRGSVTTILMSTFVSVGMQVHHKKRGTDSESASVAGNDGNGITSHTAGKMNAEYRYVEPRRSIYATVMGDEDDASTVASNSSSVIDIAYSRTPLARQTNRVKMLVHESKRRIIPELSEEVSLKSDVLMNVYVAAPHRVIASKVIVFSDTNALRFSKARQMSKHASQKASQKALQKSQKSQKSSRKGKSSKSAAEDNQTISLCAVVQIIEAGESLIVRGVLQHLPTLEKQMISDVSDKFLIPSQHDAKAWLNSTEFDSLYPTNAIPRPQPKLALCDLGQLSVRPLVLLPREVRMTMDLINRKRELEEIERQQRLEKKRKELGAGAGGYAPTGHAHAPSSDTMMKYLVDFIFNHVKLVSCTTRRRSPIIPQGNSKWRRGSRRNSFASSFCDSVGSADGSYISIDDAATVSSIGVDDDDFFSDEDDEDSDMDDIMDNIARMPRRRARVEHHEGEFGVNDDDDVEASGAEVEGDEAVRWTASHASSMRICLPGAEYLRKERNAIRMEELAVRLIQKVYRGFHGRSRYRRLVARHREQERQQLLLEERLLHIRGIRARRHMLASRVQARVRGILMRLQLEEMKRAAVLIQTRVRVLLARRYLEEEKLRQESGPPVKEQLRRAMEINGMTMMIVVYRCGSSYRISGQDVVSNAIYDCYVYESEIEILCNEHNANLPATTALERQKHLKVWQHDRITEHLLTRLRLIRRITPVTRELGAAKHDSNLELVVFEKGKPSIRNLGDRGTGHRGLLDQRETMKKYTNSFLEFEAKQLAKAKQAKIQRLKEIEQEKLMLRQMDLEMSRRASARSPMKSQTSMSSINNT